ncbi:MAG TPA: YidC/Oxa1 family membrane protein insertase [Candidatus Limiplasma pullistercoris]|nr:YidC/Oxa1 family membrane protein insertase [Candidatus Limiplasma pullistercoris]
MNDFLVAILNGINSVIHNYGWSMVVFTLLIKLVLLPLDYKSRKSMRRMTKLQPQIAKLQKKYANDKEKLNQKSAELYRKEGINPMSGCLPLLVSMAILWIMFAAMRTVANTEMASQALNLLTTGTQANESWLWIKNIWMPDSPFNPVIADNANLRMIPADIWAKVFVSLDPASVTALAQYGIDAATISGETVFAALQTLPIYAQETQLWATMPQLNLLIVNLSIYAHNNGWFILPILAAVTQYLMTLSQPQTAAADPNNPAASTNKFMKYFFPLFSLWICSSYNAIFALYWVVSNVFAWVQGLVMNKMFEKMDENQLETAGEGTLK